MPTLNPSLRSRVFEPLSRGTLFFLLAVILWGSFVRASGSGAGCGNHWPLCNGMVIPESGNWKTMVEFTHRLTSAISLVLCASICVLSFRAFSRGSLMRKAGVASLFFILTEALVGAALVLLKLVEQNDSLLRAFSMAVHLVNTYLLLGAVTLAMHWARRLKPCWKTPRRRELWLGLGSLILLAALGASGAVTALGDTLFPSHTLLQGLTQDMSPTRNLFISLRMYHPLIALLVSLYIVLFARAAISWSKEHRAQPAVVFHALMCVGLQCAQLLLGFLNFLLLAPVWIQLSHLLLSDLIWINMVLLLSTLWIGEPSAEAVPV